MRATPFVPALRALAVAALLAPLPAAAAPLALGQPVPLPDVKLKDVSGGDRTFHQVAGRKGLLVVFFCNHCPWVRAWQSRIVEIGNAAADSGLGVIAVNPNDPEALPEDAFAPMQARAKQIGMRFPYVVDGTSDVARAFGASHTPEAFLFDARGRLVYHGAVDDNAQDPSAVTQPWLRQAVDAVVAGTPVPTAETKAFGCSLKLRPARGGSL